MKARVKERMPTSAEDVVYQYFKCIDSKDLSGIVDLFDYDATVYEPFSNMQNGLRGRSSIEPFLKVAMMANSHLSREITIERASATQVTALVTFEKGDKVRGRFTFEFQNSPEGSKIKSLHILFL